MLLAAPISIPDAQTLQDLLQKWTGNKTLTHKTMYLHDAAMSVRYYSLVARNDLTYKTYSRGKHTLIFCEKSFTGVNRTVELFQVVPRISSQGISFPTLTKLLPLMDTTKIIYGAYYYGICISLHSPLSPQDIVDLVELGMTHYDVTELEIYFE